jgi:hypothetical protein
MKLAWILVFTNLLAPVGAQATTFQPVELEKMLQTSDAVVIGDFLGAKSVQLEDGSIATENRFRIDRETGLDAFDHGFSDVLVYYPGGVDGQSAQQVIGAPRFITGEKNVLVLKALPDGRLWVQGLALGTFKVVQIGPRLMAINPVFPTHHGLSLPLDVFQRRVADVKGRSMVAVVSDKYVLELAKERGWQPTGNSRSVASVKGSADNNYEPNVLDSFWLITMLASMGVLVAIWRTRRHTR